MDNLAASLKVSASGLDAQSLRLRIVSENIANAQSTSDVAGGNPYQRQVVELQSAFSTQLNAALVRVDQISGDRRPFETQFDPGNPAANDEGYVKMPNVNPLIEMADMRESNRSYQANLEVFKQAKEMITMTIDLMRSGR